MRSFAKIAANIEKLCRELREISEHYDSAMEGEGEPEFSLCSALSSESRRVMKHLSLARHHTEVCQRLHDRLEAETTKT